jgi:hypothetical protein
MSVLLFQTETFRNTREKEILVSAPTSCDETGKLLAILKYTEFQDASLKLCISYCSWCTFISDTVVLDIKLLFIVSNILTVNRASFHATVS